MYGMALTFSLPFSNFLILLLLLMLFITTLCSYFLIYHWYAYGEKRTISTGTTGLYLAGVVCFFSGMAIAILMTL